MNDPNNEHQSPTASPLVNDTRMESTHSQGSVVQVTGSPNVVVNQTHITLSFSSAERLLLGEAKDEVAEELQNEIHRYRNCQSLAALRKAAKMLLEGKLTPQVVPPKILVPLLEGASFEGDEELHTMWAALLANAGSVENGANVRAGFISTLKTLSRDEALLLSWMFDRGYNLPAYSMAYEPAGKPVAFNDLVRAYATLGFGEVGQMGNLEKKPDLTFTTYNRLQLGTCLDSLQANQLIIKLKRSHDPTEQNPEYAVTNRGAEFVRCCRCVRIEAKTSGQIDLKI